jgi:hypothetical protein
MKPTAAEKQRQYKAEKEEGEGNKKSKGRASWGTDNDKIPFVYAIELLKVLAKE